MSVVTVLAGQNLQAAISAAQGGDIIECAPSSEGGVWHEINLPDHESDTPVTLRSTQHASFAPNQMPLLTDAGMLPTIISKGRNARALTAALYSRKWNLDTLEIKAEAANTTPINVLLELGKNDTTQNTVAKVPHHFNLTRLLVHGNGALPLRGISINADDVLIQYCNVRDIINNDADTQAILLMNSTGRVRIFDNYLGSSGENFMSGGDTIKIPGVITTDMEFRRNLCEKLLAWRGTSILCKNLFEIKHGKRFIIEGNRFKTSFKSGQTGVGISIKVASNGNVAFSKYVETAYIDFINNVVEDCGEGLLIAGLDYTTGSILTNHIRVMNNFFKNIDGVEYAGGGMFVKVFNGPADCEVSHNTCINTGNIVMTDGTPCPRFINRDNIVPHNKYGIKGLAATGDATLDANFADGDLRGNVFPGGRASLYARHNLPPGNHFPATLAAVKFFDMAAGNYRLALDSPFKGLATDSTDPGVNMEALEAALGGLGTETPPPIVVIIPPPPPPPPPPPVNAPPTAAISFNQSNLAVAFSASASTDADGQIVLYSWNMGDGSPAKLGATVVHDYASEGDYPVTLTVTDDDGATASLTQIATLTLPPGAPAVAALVAVDALFAGFQTNATLRLGQTLQVRAYDQDGEPIPDSLVDYVVDNWRLATVNDIGLITPLLLGRTGVYVKARDNSVRSVSREFIITA